MCQRTEKDKCKKTPSKHEGVFLFVFKIAFEFILQE
jgi:hypothetical protein